MILVNSSKTTAMDEQNPYLGRSLSFGCLGTFQTFWGVYWGIGFHSNSILLHILFWWMQSFFYNGSATISKVSDRPRWRVWETKKNGFSDHRHHLHHLLPNPQQWEQQRLPKHFLTSITRYQMWETLCRWTPIPNHRCWVEWRHFRRTTNILQTATSGELVLLLAHVRVRQFLYAAESPRICGLNLMCW